MKQPFLFSNIISLYFNTFLERLINFCIPLKTYSEFLSLKWSKTAEMTSSSPVNFFPRKSDFNFENKKQYLGDRSGL
jgi:hypothetical protein